MTPQPTPQKPSPNWGGRRKGAGRKFLIEGEVSKILTIRVPESLMAAIKARGGRKWAREVLAKAVQGEEP